MLRAGVLSLALVAALCLPSCGLFRRGPSVEKQSAIDLNEASLRKIEQLPGITPSMARRIVDGRPYRDPHELVERGILTEHELARILNQVRVKDRED